MATARPVSSSFSSSSLFDMAVVILVDCEDFLRGLADEGDETERLRPIAAAAPVLLGLVMREERAAVAWNDMLPIVNVYNTVWMRGGKRDIKCLIEIYDELGSSETSAWRHVDFSRNREMERIFSHCTACSGSDE